MCKFNIPLSNTEDRLYSNAVAFESIATDRIWKLLPILEPALAINMLVTCYEYTEWHEKFKNHFYFFDERLWPSDANLQSINDIESAIADIFQSSVLAELANLYLLIVEKSEAVLPGCDDFQYINACNLAKAALGAIAKLESNTIHNIIQYVDTLKQKLENALQDPRYCYDAVFGEILHKIT